MRIARIARKVPQVTAIFWIIKLLSTALGESASDYLVHTIEPIIAVAIGGVFFTAALFFQLKARRYIPWIYWLTVVMVAIFGTMAADVVHIALHVPYLASSIFFAVALVVSFFVWNKTEKTLSIHSITNLRRELFYWLTVVTTFALGTAVGDMTAITFGLGYLTSGILFALLFVLPGAAYFKFGLNGVIAFWFAYIVTRPFGASFADWFGRTPELGGIGFGTDKTSIALAIIIFIFVIYLTKSQIHKIRD